MSEAKGRQTHTHTKKAKTKTGDTAYLLICASLFMYVMCLVNVHFCISGLAVNTSLFLNWIETNEKNQRNEQRERKMMYLKNRITRKRVEVDTLQPSRNVLDRLRRRRWRWRWTDG